MARYLIHKCICHDREFTEIKKYARDHNIDSIEELQQQNFCSCGCRMCMPYVELMLQTGETSFEPGTAHRRNKK